MAQVREALDTGARTRREVVAMTGLDAGVVDATVDLLIRAGAIDVHRLTCGTGGCGTCALNVTCTPSRVTPLRITRGDRPR